MGKVKQWLMTMEEDAAELSKLFFCAKHGAVHQDIWDRVNDPDNDNGSPREQTTRYNQDFSWQVEIDSFVQDIILNRPIKSGCSDDALKTMELVYKIYQSDLEWAKKYNI